MGLDMYAYSVPVAMLKGKRVDPDLGLDAPAAQLDAAGLSFYVSCFRDEEACVAGGYGVPKLRVRKKVKEFFRWRKHPDLHGWFTRLYLRRGGACPIFSLTGLVLDEDDIADLERDVLAKRLPKTSGSGFLFGESYPFDAISDIAFIAKARQELRAGRAVVYVPWW
jgi:hypothetical protein